LGEFHKKAEPSYYCCFIFEYDKTSLGVKHIFVCIRIFLT